MILVFIMLFGGGGGFADDGERPAVYSRLPPPQTLKPSLPLKPPRYSKRPVIGVVESFQRGGEGVLVFDPGQFADGVHAELRDADVDGADAESRGGDGADGGAARHIGAHRESLERQAGALAHLAEHGRGLGVGGVSLVAVGFDDRAGVQQRAVVRFVLVRVVGVDAVRVVGRDQHRAAERALQGRVVGAHAAQNGAQKRPVGAAAGGAADFLVVVQN